MKKNWLAPLIFWVLFEAVAIILWLSLDNLFYLFNFSYIGTCLAVGIYLYSRKWKYARNAVQWAVGLYMLVYLGLIDGENMQIEGFWYYLFLGVFEAATIHYFVAKLAGPLFFGRGWCGFACWTAMVLDVLPYKQRQAPRKNWEWMRYGTFAISLLYVATLFLLGVKGLERIMLISFIAGNALYYALGVILAFALKDNRAFCKYLCPVAVFLKPASYYARLRVTCDRELCVSCGKCRRVCPMDVDMTDNARSRERGTECILCMRCVDECPKRALKL